MALADKWHSYQVNALGRRQILIAKRFHSVDDGLEAAPFSGQLHKPAEFDDIEAVTDLKRIRRTVHTENGWTRNTALRFGQQIVKLQGLELSTLG